MTIEEKIKRLTDVAHSLNQKTDEMELVFKHYNAKLSNINVGVSAVLDDKINPSYGIGEGELNAWLFGYGKYQDEWRFVAHRVFFKSETSKPTYFATMPIESAPRKVRVEALRLLAKLVNELTTKAERFADEIEEAKQQAGKLTINKR